MANETMKMESLTLKVTGDPYEVLLMHNGLLADRDYEWTRKLAAATRKRNRTDEDHEEVARLEWNGSLYFDDEIGPYMPGNNFRRALLDAGRLTKEGKSIERGVLRVGAMRDGRLSRNMPLGYDGPRTREAMWADHRFRHRAVVKVGTSKVVRTRPQFAGWSFTSTIDYDAKIIDRADLMRIAESAGQYIGIGDGRPFFAGRFEIEAL